MQCLVSTTPGQSVALFQPEAMLFPSIFWKEDGIGSVLGAIPNALMAHAIILHKNGFDSLQSHLRSRLTNMACATSTDPRYIAYAFECMMNLNLNGQDCRVMLSRTPAATGEKPDTSMGRGSRQETMFDTDSIDSRPVVNPLAAALAEEPATYFYIHTCNQKDHFGVAPLKKWLDSDKIMDQFCDDIPGNEQKQGLIQNAIMSGASIMLNCQWMEIAKIFMDFIANSPKEPLGKTRKSGGAMNTKMQKGISAISMHYFGWKTNQSKSRIVVSAARSKIFLVKKTLRH